MAKMWANSGDSHFLEPPDLFDQMLPRELAKRMPHTVHEDGYDITTVDGKTIRRRAPGPAQQKMREATRPPGAFDPRKRLADLDQEGIWGEVTYPSLGLWYGEINDPALASASATALNDWVWETGAGASPRLVVTATLPLQSIEDSARELERVAEMGYRVVFLPSKPPEQTGNYNLDVWEPIWDIAERANMVLGVHIGSDAGESPVKFKGPGGAIINYVETTYGGQRSTVQMVASGVFERHPDLRLLISEGGATWVPFIGDRMNEAYRQHAMFSDGRISKAPKEYLGNVYASFQHDESAVPAAQYLSYPNVMWGSDYPHLEGTYGHTQKTLHELFDDVDPAWSYRIRVGAFLELFPEVGPPPEDPGPPA